MGGIIVALESIEDDDDVYYSCEDGDEEKEVIEEEGEVDEEIDDDGTDKEGTDEDEFYSGEFYDESDEVYYDCEADDAAEEKEEIEEEEKYRSIFDYDPNFLPTEFHQKRLSDFLEGYDPLSYLDRLNAFLFNVHKKEQPRVHLVFMTAKILSRICEFLTPQEYLDLSLTCRFLHWRIFTFCQCTIPRQVINLKKIPGTDQFSTNLNWESTKANKKRYFAKTARISLYSEVDDLVEHMEYLTYCIMTFRDRIDYLMVLLIRNSEDRGERVECHYEWNNFLKTVRADFFTCYKLDGTGLALTDVSPCFLTMPYINQMDCLVLKIQYSQNDKIDWTRLRLNNRVGLYVALPVQFLRQQVREFNGNLEYSWRRFNADEEDLHKLFKLKVRGIEMGTDSLCTVSFSSEDGRVDKNLLILAERCFVLSSGEELRGDVSLYQRTLDSNVFENFLTNK